MLPIDQEIKVLKKIKTWMLTDGSVVLESKQLGWIFAFLIFLNLGIFLGGYFLGRNTGAQEWYATISRDAFADQIYNSLCLSSMDANDKDEEEDSDVQDGSDDASSESDVTFQAADNNNVPEQGLEMKTQYYAQLAGFSSLRSAEAFAARMNNKHIPVLIKERKSKNSRGRQLTWYQVVTEPYEDQDALNSVVAILKKEERLHDVRIVQG
jgi:hypothetical protein